MMEFSSPLAAMHPPAGPTWGGCRDLPSSRLMYSGRQTLAPSTFNFRELSMVKQSNDYFSMRPQRGSSPTASLAADLSSNFHIDQSPQFPTPRRSLFSRDLFTPLENQDFLVTPPVDCEGATTPPIPSSSPGIDLMDVSPLPHKAPRAPCFIARVTLPSPSPEETPEDEEMLSPEASPVQETPLAPLPVLELPIRAVPGLRRPSLLRSKMYSTTSVPKKTSKESLLPAFQFGSGLPGLTCSSTTSLCETMTESPVDENLSSLPSSAASRRPSLAMSRNNGSPMGGFVRKPSVVPAGRPKKQMRRSLSMFQHPDDVMKDREDYAPPLPTLQAADLDAKYQHKLPHSPPDEPDSLPRIQQDTLLNVLNGDYSAHYDDVKIIDCRFEYEYQGGHINGAVNYNDKDLLAKELFDNNTPSARTLLILHCEYSVHRAPRMAKFVRNRDRSVNDFQYPKLSYPEMYILDGGYSKFFEQQPTRCFPQNYVEMEHKDHEKACERGMGKLKQRQKLARAQTFAFGQKECQMEDSPTALGSRMTMGIRSFSNLDISYDTSPAFGRRLASY